MQMFHQHLCFVIILQEDFYFIFTFVALAKLSIIPIFFLLLGMVLRPPLHVHTPLILIRIVYELHASKMFLKVRCG